jgi:hypothetical protein
MSELIGEMQNAYPIFTDDFRIHLDRMSRQWRYPSRAPGIAPHEPSRLVDISDYEVRKKLESTG